MKATPLLTRLTALILVFLLILTPVSAIAYDDQGNPVTVIVLDPGHGGIDSGTVGEHDGKEIYESHLNLKIANYCRSYLEENYRNIRVLMTRETDEKVSLDECMEFALANGADFMLSIHLNSNNGSARGALGIVPAGNYRPEQAETSRAAASAILEELSALGLTNRGFMTTFTDSTRYPNGSRKDGFMIIRSCVEANIPGIIMEQAFLDSSSDYHNYLDTDEKLEALGIANALGLAKTLDLEEKGDPTSADMGDTPFTDVYVGAWYYDDVTYVWEQGMMEGTSESTFSPASTATRAMVVTLLYRLDGGTHSAETPTFTDVAEGTWYYDPVEWAVENQVTKGVSETEFAPNRNVSRQQFVTFLYRYASLLGLDLTVSGESAFADADQIGAYAREAVLWAEESKLVTGYGDGTFRPDKELNRAELAVLMHRFHQYLLYETGVLAYDWTLSHTEQELYIGDRFELTLTNQFGKTANVLWVPDTEGVVEISGNTVTAVGVGEALVTCEKDGTFFDCLVIVSEKVSIWTISHTEQALYTGESFELTLTDQFDEAADVTWTADAEGIVEIDGSTITAVAPGEVTLSCQLEDQLFQCVVTVTEKISIWTISHTEQALYTGESFELTLTDQFDEVADVTWTADAEGIVEIDGSTITAVAPGEVTLSCQLEDQLFQCVVTVTEEPDVWTISHTDVTIQVGESFNLRLRNQDGETASVTWTASKSGYVTISGNKITGAAKGTITVSCSWDGQTYSCIVRVKSS